ncbi:hypothetical protein QR680_018179 [Steinernema hermaphroditum]|uniref:Piwi domain-containing protein n=1 Tax=Steinernema hermaphroditum TaxID=289476 RepID=A0AA39LQE0_9BILA|nr:hypothetical protein QR680_018179 [Steinernema hermaphroditum]
MAEQESDLRPATRIRQEAEKKFKEMGIEVGDPIMPPRIPVPPNGNVKLITNLFPITTHRQIPVFRWDVEINIALRNGRQLALTKKSDSDAVAIERKSKTRIIFEKMIENHSDILGAMEECYYDMESTLYTLRDIRKDPTEEVVMLVINELPAQKFQGTTSATVQLKKVHDRFEIDLTNFAHISPNVGSTDLSHKQFLELVTSQIPIMSDQFVTFPGGVSFSMQASTTELPEAKYLGHGIQKSIRYVENMQSHKPQAAVAVDLKKTAFHAVMTGLEYLSQLVDARPIWENRRLPESFFGYGPLKKMKGLRCSLNYGQGHRYREIVIHEISPKTARELKFEREGQSLSVEAYYQQAYNIRIRYPSAPLAVEKKPGQRNLSYYPLELISILDNQRVTGELPQKVIKDVIREAAVLPARRAREIQRACQEIQLFNNPYIENVSTEISPDPIKVEGRTLRNPRLIYGKGFTLETRGGAWPLKGGNRPTFVVPASIEKWSVLMISNKKNGHAASTMDGFISAFMAECRTRGMNMARPTDPWPLQAERDVEPQMESFFAECQQLNIEFVLVLQDDCFHEHKFLKYLERKYNVITQDVNMKTVDRCIDRSRAVATLENIVQKTNIKLGGLNYSIDMTNPDGTKQVFDKETMFVGLAMSHSKPPKPDATGREPPKPASVVGFAANVLPQHFAFIGDYYYQAANRDEKIDSILPIMQRLLEHWCLYHDGQMPKSILFFRNGASEGQYKSILRYEIPLIKKALSDYREASNVEQNYPETKFSVVVATKRHNVRIFKANIPDQARANEQNLQPGIAVDRSITHPVFAEFYVNSHTTLQGTGKTPRYTIMYNEADFKLGQLEHIVFGLAHGHQIVNLCTSLPTPSYIAGDYADRGMAVLHQYLRQCGAPIDDYDQFNEMLTYHAIANPNSRFHTCRVNA